MLDWLEQWMGKWSGKDEWPTVKAAVESHVSSRGLEYRNPRTARHTIVSYQVGGQIFTGAIRNITGQSLRPGHKGSTISLQYNPQRPKDYYFAPACKLAGRAVAFLIALLGLIALLLINRP